jgi:eukaryotic-like serine/threonine-protein kinase
VAPIGTGGMGGVYKARDTRLDRTVAIKILPEDTALREDFRARFEREAVASLNPPTSASSLKPARAPSSWN